jgi:hypothetical protein
MTVTTPGAPAVGRFPASVLCVPGAVAAEVAAGCSGWAAAVQLSISCIFAELVTFWLLTKHCDCGTSLPTEPPKVVFTPWARRMATAFA